MKTISFIAAIAATMVLMSCSKSEQEVLTTSDSELNIKTSFGEIQTRTTISDFPDQAAIGLFITNGTLGMNYDNIADNANVKSLYDGGTWRQTPTVYLSPANATVFAYYPYVSSNNNGAAIPIEHNTQTDYLYGTHAPGQSNVNSSNPSVNLIMRHALSLLQFNINKNTYTGPGLLTEIEICNEAGKTALFSEGLLNISTGNIANIPTKNQAVVVNGSYTLPATVSMLVLPVISNISTGDILINLTIDSKKYTLPVQANTKWEQGKVNVYNLILRGKDLVVSNISITDWTSGVSGNMVLQ